MSRTLIEDLFRDDNVEIIAVSGWNSVRAAVAREAGWEQIRSEGTRYCGIMDRDMRSDEDVAELAAKGVFCLPLNEAESFLIDPEIATWMLSKSAGKEITREEYITILVECANVRRREALEKLARYLERWKSPEIEFKLDEANELLADIKENAQLIERFQRRGREVIDVVENQDVNAILRLFKGKSLYRELVGQARKQLSVTLPTEPAQKYNEIREYLIEQKKWPAWALDLRKRVLAHLAG